jgi:hypothetical protein
MRVTRVTLVFAVAGALALVAVADAAADDAEAVLDRARNATVREDFSGIVQIEWLRDGEWHIARVPASGTGGTVQVGEGTRQAEGRGNERWIAGVSGWQAGWNEPVGGKVPAPSEHWRLSLQRGEPVAGRSTLVVTASDRRTSKPRLKVYCDRDTGVLLRREVLDRRGRVVRAVGFVEVKKLGGARSVPPPEPKGKKHGAPVEVTRLPAGYAAPAEVAGRYVLAGRYRRDDGVVQLYYTDGLFGVSVFEQQGDLDWNGLPRGGAGVNVRGAQARTYEVAGGTVLVWERDDVTLTVVSDATVEDLRLFASAFDGTAKEHESLIDKITGFVLGPFGFE